MQPELTMSGDTTIASSRRDEEEDRYYEKIQALVYRSYYNQIAPIPTDLTPELVEAIYKAEQKYWGCDAIGSGFDETDYRWIIRRIPPWALINVTHVRSIQIILKVIDSACKYIFFRDEEDIIPTNSYEHSVVGNAMWQLGSKVEAIGHFDLAVHLSPRNVRARVDRAEVYSHFGRFSEARNDLEYVRNYNSGDLSDYHLLCKIANISLRVGLLVAAGEFAIKTLDLIQNYLKHASIEEDRMLVETESMVCYIELMIFDQLVQVAKNLTIDYRDNVKRLGEGVAERLSYIRKQKGF